MEMEGFTALPECSRKAQTTPDRARYWLKLLGVETIKKGNVRYVPNAAADLLGNMARLVANGLPPAEAAKKAKDETPTEIAPVKDSEIPGNDAARLEGIEKAMLAMAEQMRVMVEENRFLRSEISALQKGIEFKGKDSPADTPRQVGPPVQNLAPKLKTDPNLPAPIREKEAEENGFMKELREVQEWIGSLFSPFVEVFKGS